MRNDEPLGAARELVEKAFGGQVHRMLSDGAHYRDFLDVRVKVKAPADWCRCWVEAACIHEAIADKALAHGHAQTAGEALARAAIYCHFGQGYFTDDRPEERIAAENRKQALFRRAAPLLSPPLEAVEIAFDGGTLPGYLRLAKPGERNACVILVGGLDTTKEDALALSDVLVSRGLATLAFDGPGQGETYYRMPLIQDFERAIFAAVDYLSARIEIDPARIGVLGRSTGGHWACKSAALDERIRAAVAWGLIYHARELDRMPPDVQSRFTRAAHLSSRAEEKRFYEGYDLATFSRKITCPIMIVQGGRDPIAPPEGARQLAAEAKGPVDLMLFAESGHCCHDRSHIIKPAMADFLVQHLMGGKSRPRLQRVIELN